MTFSTTQLGLMVLMGMCIIGVISYFLGLRKTNSAIKASALGFVFAVIPVLGIIYVVYLAAKEDIIRAK